MSDIIDAAVTSSGSGSGSGLALAMALALALLPWLVLTCLLCHGILRGPIRRPAVGVERIAVEEVLP